MGMVTKTFISRDSLGNDQIMIVNQKKNFLNRFRDVNEHIVTVNDYNLIPSVKPFNGVDID